MVLFRILLLLQTFSFPGQFAYTAEQSPDTAYLRWPPTALAAYWLLWIQVVVVCAWKLLSLVQADRVLSAASLTWVDGIVWAVAAAWSALAVVFLVVGFRADDPGLPLLLFLVVVGVAVLGLLMVVMRALLRQATALRSDMEAVI